MHGPSTITLKKVAERAGVSITTVSLTLRGDTSRRRVSEETRRRVLEAAQALRYHPNARGRALRSGRTNIIGLYAGYGSVNARLPFFTEVISGLQEGCEQIKKDLLLHGIFHGNTSQDIFTELVDGRIDGLVVHMPQVDLLAKRLADSELPVVAVAEPLPGIPSVVVDDAAGSRLLVQHLTGRGYRRFLYVSSTFPMTSAEKRRDAFLAAAAEGGLEVEEIRASDMPASDEKFLQRLVPSEGRQPTAIVCWNDHTAYEVLARCHQCDLRVPEDIALAGFDGCPAPYQDVRFLTTIRAPWAAAARTAVQYLSALLEGEPVPPVTVLPVELISGKTA